jgi:hypothetical protein
MWPLPQEGEDSSRNVWGYSIQALPQEDEDNSCNVWGVLYWILLLVHPGAKYAIILIWNFFSVLE